MVFSDAIDSEVNGNVIMSRGGGQP
jgi:hypothetical protein